MTSHFLKFFGIVSLALIATLAMGIDAGAKTIPTPGAPALEKAKDPEKAKQPEKPKEAEKAKEPAKPKEAEKETKAKECKPNQKNCKDCPPPRGNPSPGKPKSNPPCP